ncbi:tyrosine-type recombinase/integrase [Herbaspirillum chlorophenolicum]|uniref:tyrosine-type recombinase/integrase n=1 Tax=Herbaspirillum chlorophenolicum TaxID=211589 RepID=UPI00067AE507|nr:tyrosine-type recombinase/integrase [Herbaspirillum chlorophenolicum]
MALVNVRKEVTFSSGHHSWLLTDVTGVEIVIFTAFCESILGLAYETRERYATVVARFIDYLYEIEILGGQVAHTRTVINRALKTYIELLRCGKEISFTNPKYPARPNDVAREIKFRAIAQKLGITPLASNSWSNTLAALNRFLAITAELEIEAYELALLKGGVSESVLARSSRDVRILWDAVNGARTLSYQEIQHIKTTSMLGGVTRFKGKLKRPKALKQSTRQSTQMDINALDFPEEYFPALIEHTRTYRDKARWSLLIGSGIRQSEGNNLLWGDINFEKREVYVFNPVVRVLGRNVSIRDSKLRFKGRTKTETLFREPYKSQFFYFIQRYREEEYRLPPDGNDFVFQMLPDKYLGMPLLEANDGSLTDLFKGAVKRARIPGPQVNAHYIYTPHSLRHAFGAFLANEVGLTDAELQLAMGHKSPLSSRKYRNTKLDSLQRKLERYDRSVIYGQEDSLSPTAPTSLK